MRKNSAVAVPGTSRGNCGGETNSGTRVVLPVQALEDSKNLLFEFRLDSDAVILHREEHIFLAAFGSDVDARRLSAPVFYRVPD